MTAKEKQLDFIKVYLKPTLKQFFYKTAGQTWWKDKGDFFTLINLQNFSWNSKDAVDFCFNTGIVLKVEIKDTNDINKKPMTVYLREGFYLPAERKEHKYRNKTGYEITNQTDIGQFISELKIDFEQYILPYLENLNTLEDCLSCFGEITFWGDNLKRVIKDSNI
jgi:hypothetical protein